MTLASEICRVSVPGQPDGRSRELSESEPALRRLHPGHFTLPWGLAVFAAFAMTAPRLSARDIKPLFPVQIEHEFPNPEASCREVMELITEHYYTDEVDDKTLWWGAVEGMLRALSPEENKSLAKIWQPKDYEKIDQSLRGIQESIGIKSSFNPADGSLTVTEVVPGGPSETLLKPYDRIVRIDTTPLKGLSVQEVQDLLKGEVGTRVSLKVVRDVAIFDLLVTRSKVKLHNVRTQAFPGDVEYIALKKFSKGVSEEIREAIQECVKEGVTRVLLDLRGNTGGVLNEALACSKLFVAKGKPVMILVSHGSKMTKYVSDNTEPFDVRLAVLIDKHSASASEIVAAALRDEAGALLVGTRTFGKATMEKTFALKNKYRVRFTNAAIYSPKGKTWQKNGLLPDIPVDQDVTVAAKLRKLPAKVRLLKDVQLRAAYRVLLAAEPD